MSVILAEVPRVKKPWEDYGRRAWAAWHSLDERAPDGAGPPSLNSLAKRTKRAEQLLNYGEMNKFLRGEYAEPSWRVARGVAEALGVDLDWLMLGEGEAPRRSVDLGRIPPWPGPRESAKKPKGRARMRPEEADEIAAEERKLQEAQKRKLPPPEAKPKADD